MPMATREIWHEILINASPIALYKAVTDVKNLAHWWTTDTRGESKVGKQLEFWFGGMCQLMQVTTLQPNKLVRWNAKPGGAPGWAGTQIEFNIFRDDNKTFLHFRHSNWHEEAKLFPHCSMGWAIFLLSLKEFVKTGKGRKRSVSTSGRSVGSFVENFSHGILRTRWLSAQHFPILTRWISPH